MAGARRGALLRSVAGIGVYAGAFGATFGAVAAGSGLSPLQTVVLSAVMFTGASQFAFAGVIAAGGAPLTAVPGALLLGVRNLFYGVPVSEILRPRGWARLWTAHFIIDETTGMAMAQSDVAAGRLAFWLTAGTLFCCWNLGTFAGMTIGQHIDISRFGLDAASPAIFLALVWPQLRRHHAKRVALGGAMVAALLITVTPAGVPVIASAVPALVAGMMSSREKTPPASPVAAGDEG